MLHIVLYEPKIPQNTGTIARATAALGHTLHLIEPLGFTLDDKQVKRAGLDYWPQVILKTHKSWHDFLACEEPAAGAIKLLTTKATRLHWDASFKAGDYLVFGSETAGLPESIHGKYPDQRFRLEMRNEALRSLNLATAVCAVQYEAERQIRT